MIMHKMRLNTLGLQRGVLPLLIYILSWIGSPSSAEARQTTSDQIVAVVNDRIVLKSDVDNEVAQYMNTASMQNQTVSFSDELWYSFLESIIDNHVMLEKAVIDSIEVSEDMVDRQMDARIQQLIAQAGSERALEEAFGQSIIQIRAQYRDQFKDQLTVQQVQQSMISDITITRPEVEEFFDSIPEDQLPTIPEQVSLSQIVIDPPLLEGTREASFNRAQALRDSVTIYEKNFEEMARKYSAGPSARNGGLLPLMPLDDLVSSYSAAAAALSPGEISEVVETQFGFHVIRLNKREGDLIETNHILVELDRKSVDEDAAILQLNELREQIQNGDITFRQAAIEHSQDEATATMGGRIIDQNTGSRLLPLNQLEPSLYRIALLLTEGDISEPKSFTKPGSDAKSFRIVRMDRMIQEHRANLKEDYERIKNIALEQKQMRVFQEKLSDFRDEVYIEYKIEMPESSIETSGMVTP
jgi:peptidyl-prolyl cis-trans isomerase SurA